MKRIAASGEAAAGRDAGRPGPSLQEHFDRLERMIDDAVELIDRLRSENRELAHRLAESEQVRKTAARRLDALLGRIERVT